MMTNWVKAPTIRFSIALIVALTGLLLVPAPSGAVTSSYTFAPTTPVAGEPVTFTFTGTCDAPPCRIQWRWFGDGASSLGTTIGEGEVVDYAFGDPGSYQVVAKISLGNGTNTNATSTQVVVVEEPAAPSPPRGVTVVPGDGRVSVAWVASASAGGAAITGYTATSTPGGASCTTTGLSCVVKGLTNQKAYAFKVVAQSTNGVSPAATSPVATPQPAAAVKVKAKKGKSVLLVDVNPSQGERAWVFQLERERKNGSWKSLGEYRTEGSKERLRINLKKGTYRVAVRPKDGYRGVISKSVRLTK